MVDGHVPSTVECARTGRTGKGAMPTDRLVIEFPSAGATYCREEYGVYQYDVYPHSSVLAGQERRTFLGSFDTLDEARAEFPDAKWSGEGSGYREISIPHTPPDWFDPAAAGEVWDDKDY